MRTNFALLLLIIFTGAAVTGWEWPDIAKIMPVYVAAIPGLMMISTISHDAAGLRPISMNQEGFCHGAAFQPRCSVNQGGSR